MKKLIAFFVFLSLIAAVVIIPNIIRDLKKGYEQRMLEAISAIRNAIRSVSDGQGGTIDIYAPSVEQIREGGVLVVTGIVGWPAGGKDPSFESFNAEMRNLCGGGIDSDCLRVDTLVVGESKLIEGGEVIHQISAATFNLTQNSENVSEQDGAASLLGSTSSMMGEIGTASSSDDQTSSQGSSPSRKGSIPDDLVADIQRSLEKLGYDPGPVDNVVGPRTFSAILAYQRRHGLKIDGNPTVELLNHMRTRNRDDRRQR